MELVLNSETLPELDENLFVWRLTALWAFSEAAFGGILFALKIPFTGLFIGSLSVIFISLISYYSSQKEAVFKSFLSITRLQHQPNFRPVT